MDRLTPSQRDAVGARGNVLMVAGAGTGKTLTLVKRCVSLLAAGESLEHLLLVTFTEAAAAEMRHRIGEALRAALASASTVPLREHFERQLALMDSAHISTLHAFCLELVRRHFHDLSIDPEVRVLDETQTQPLIRGTLDALFERHCAEHAPTYPAVRDLIRNGGRGSDVGLRPLIVRIHRYTQTLPCRSDGWPPKCALLSSPRQKPGGPGSRRASRTGARSGCRSCGCPPAHPTWPTASPRWRPCPRGDLRPVRRDTRDGPARRSSGVAARVEGQGA